MDDSELARGAQWLLKIKAKEEKPRVSVTSKLPLLGVLEFVSFF